MNAPSIYKSPAGEQAVMALYDSMIARWSIPYETLNVSTRNRRLPTQVLDSNGNYLQISYKSEANFPPMAINYIVDTLGRVIQFHYGEWPAPSSTSLSSITTPTGTVTLGYQTVTMNYNYTLGELHLQR